MDHLRTRQQTIDQPLQPAKADHSWAQFPHHVDTHPMCRLDLFDELDGESHQQNFQKIVPNFQHHLAYRLPEPEPQPRPPPTPTLRIRYWTLHRALVLSTAKTPQNLAE